MLVLGAIDKTVVSSVKHVVKHDILFQAFNELFILHIQLKTKFLDPLVLLTV